MTHEDILKDLCAQATGHPADEWQATLLKGEGSNRKYYRLTHDKTQETLIGVSGENATENHAFITLARHFAQKGVHTPQVKAVSPDELYYVQEDLGDTSLYQRILPSIGSGQWDAPTRDLLKRTLDVLLQIQFKGGEGLNYSVCYPIAEWDERSIKWDLNYFKYCFLKLEKQDFSEPELETDFDHLTANLLACEPQAFMYRDFQSRNVQLKDGEPWGIDFQGGRRGPVLYDLASFVWQTRAHYPAHLQQELVDYYYTALQQYAPMDREAFDGELRLLVLFRTLQVLGAYGYRGLFEQKEHFKESLPQTLKNLAVMIAQGQCDAYPHLKQTLLQLAARQEAKEQHLQQLNRKDLTVKVYSFSYKKGIPTDNSGNGGGYVFDCRGVHNPGKYDQYKPLTGRDQPVKDFLEKDGEILKFLQSIYALADAHVERYMERGFSSLMFSCGCTGGRHRSVYSAQHLAEHLARKYGIKVELRHVEQHIEEKFNF